MKVSLFFLAIISTALGCSPTGNPGTPGTGGTTSPVASYSMTIQPPGRWSHPKTEAAIRPPQIATTAENAHKRILNDILQAVNLILIDNKYPVDAIKVTLGDADFRGNILPTAPTGMCSEEQSPGFVLSPEMAIEQWCERMDAPVARYPAQELTGKFDATASGFAVTEAQWKSLGVKLQQALSELGAVFTNDLTITPMKA